MSDQDIYAIWNQVLRLLEKSLNRPAYETLVTSAKPVSYQQGKFEVAVPNKVVKDWLAKYCVPLLEQELQAFLADLTLVNFVVGPEELFSTPLFDPAPAVSKNPIKATPAYLNIRYTFEAFVVGQGNRFAHAAALAVAESPATAYNPLFIYGGVGLGKTHLMQAISHSVLSRHPKTKILYTTSEMFTNNLINAIRDGKTLQFRNKYRNLDILMVDDVQFIAGKERTQEEFFHTFNALHDSSKQIILSSDRPPKEILTLEERLRSRFEWGLTADIQAPDFETRIAILKKKAEISGISVSDDLLSLIASKIVTNIRQLEGALIRVVAQSSLTNCEITLPLVDQVLKEISTPQKEALKTSIDMIKKITAEYFGLKVDELQAKIRTEKIAFARQIAMYLSRELLGASLPKIGEEFGGRDHSTVIHACKKMAAAIKKDPQTSETIKKISTSIKKFTPVNV